MNNFNNNKREQTESGSGISAAQRKPKRPRRHGTRSRGKDGDRSPKFEKPESIENPDFHSNSPTANNFAWWDRVNGVTSTLAQVWLDKVKGTPFPVGNFQEDASNLNPVSCDNPSPDSASIGLYVFEWVPSVGINADQLSVVNQALRTNYVTLNTARTGSLIGEPADFMIYTLAISQLHLFVAEATRLYGLTRNYDALNRYQSDLFIEGLGFDVASFRVKNADFRGWLNSFIARINQLPLINAWSAFHSWRSLTMTIYKDSQSRHSSFFAWRLAGFYMYNKDSGALELKSWFDLRGDAANKSVMTRDDLINIGEKLYANMFSNMDFVKLGVVLRTAYGEDSLLVSPEVPEEYSIQPEFNAERLLQLENTEFPSPFIECNNIHADPGFIYQVRTSSSDNKLTCMAHSLSSSNTSAQPRFHFDITQSDGYVRSSPYWQYSWSQAQHNAGATEYVKILSHFSGFLNFRGDIPSVEAIVEASRFKTLYKWFSEPDSDVPNRWISTVRLETGGTEIVLNAYTYHFNYNAASASNGIGVYGALPLKVMKRSDGDWRYTNSMFDAVELDYFPFVYAFSSKTTTTPVPGGDPLSTVNVDKVVHRAGDVDFAAPIARDWLVKLNEAVMQSAFFIPANGLGRLSAAGKGLEAPDKPIRQ